MSKDIEYTLGAMSNNFAHLSKIQHNDMKDLIKELRRLNDILEKNTVEEVKDAVSTERED